MSTFKDLRNIILAAAAAGFVVGAAAQSASHRLPGGGWYYDPSVHGMLDLKAIRPIEGCNLPGGLTKITSSDEPGVSAPFWCGTPPFCLTDSATGVSESCTIMPYARRNPRYSPTGTPGVNSIRNPEDLRCGNTGLQPINSRCPIVPTARITFNNSTNLNVNTGASITVRVTTTNAKPEWGGSATLNCTGANANRSPFNSKNVALNVNNYSIGSGTVPSAGTLNCTLTVSNWRGTATATAKVTIKAPAPKPPSGGGGSGGGSGSGGTNDTFLNGCNAKSYTAKMNHGHQPDPSKIYCEWSLPTMSNGQAIKMFSGRVKGKDTIHKPISCVRYHAIISTLSCNNGKHVLAGIDCYCSDGR